MVQIPDGPSDSWCPFWKKKQSVVCKTCPMWVKHTMSDLQRSVHEDRWAWALALAPGIQLSSMHRIMGVQQAVESFRNEMVNQNQQLLGMAEAQKYLRGKDDG